MVRLVEGSVVGRTTERTEAETRTEEIFSGTNWGQPSLHLNVHQVFFIAVKLPERDVGQSPLSSGEVESKWSYTLHLATLCAPIRFARQLYLNFNEWRDSK